MGTCTIENIGDVCRLCAKNHEHMKSIYIKQCIKHNLKFLIQKLLPFIDLNENDILPNRICVDCTTALIVFNNLWETSKIINEEFKLLIIESENKVVVNEENEKKLNDPEDSPNFSKVEDSINFMPLKLSVQHLATDNEDQNTLKSITAYDNEEEYVTYKPCTLNATHENSINKSINHGDSSQEHHMATNSPILLNALTQPQPPPERIDSPGDQRNNSGAAITVDHTYALLPQVRWGSVDHTYAMCRQLKTMTAATKTETPAVVDEALSADRDQKNQGAAATNDDRLKETLCDQTTERSKSSVKHRETESDKATHTDVRSFLDRFRVDVDGTQRYYKCDRCPYYTRTQLNAAVCFRRHYELHTTGFDVKCDRCERTFRTVGAMREHVAVVHHGVKKHACPQCGKRFAAWNTLKTHRLMHSGERPYACEECGKRFRHVTKVKKHVLFVHRKQRDHRCPVCDKPYFTATQVRMHMKRHTGVRDHVCDVCGKAFLTKKTLTEHAKMVHGGPGRFVCATCGKAYKTKRNMVLHRKTTARCGGADADDLGGPRPPGTSQSAGRGVLVRS